jgi:tetratricopeptide (TPR) repeat protein
MPIFILATLLACPPIPSTEPMFAGLGDYHRTVSTQNRTAQKYFDQGLKFLYGFNHDEAIKSFQAAAQADPGCAMAWWGIATANGPHVNNPMVMQQSADMAMDALAHATTARASQIERGLILAANQRFDRHQMADQAKLDLSYAKAMTALWNANPKDQDVGVMSAEAWMDLQPWDYWTNDGKPKGQIMQITQTIDRVLKMNPYHPMALHLAIHAWEASGHPEKALVAANRLRYLQPGLGHMVHMPSHTYIRIGNWPEAIAANERAIKSDEMYRKIHPVQGFYRIYMAHNRHMLGFAAMMVGRSQMCIDSFESLQKEMPDEFVKAMAPGVDGFVSMPLEAKVRFGRWQEVLDTPEYPEYVPLSRAPRHAARGVAYSAQGQMAEALTEQQLFEDGRKLVPAEWSVGNNSAASILEIAHHHLAGEIFLAQNRMDESVAELHQAVDAEDQLRYDEPPDWIIPTRHLLGVALLKANRFADAEQVYRQDLVKYPGNGWSLYGLWDALRSQNKPDAAAVKAQFDKNWAKADLQISSSCMCSPRPR